MRRAVSSETFSPNAIGVGASDALPTFAPTPMALGLNVKPLILDRVRYKGEQRELLPSLDRVEHTLGEKPAHALADGVFATGPNIDGLEQRGIGFFTNIPAPDPAANPAVRPDPTQPVPPEQWDQLPISSQTKKLDKACFVYDAATDTFLCPQGRAMPFEETSVSRSSAQLSRGEKFTWRVYRGTTCDGVAGAGVALDEAPGFRETLQPRPPAAPSNKGGRTVSRDTYAPQREQLAAKMRGEESRKKYDQRMRIAETPFALIKQVLGLRQFLLRGLTKVKLEWLWTCAAINLDKLARGLARLCTKLEVEALK